MSNSLQESNRAALLASGKTVIVLDDDPTGTQTVFDLPVLTSWSNGEIAAAIPADHPVTVVSRSDSTLRGHYPLETDVLAEALGIDAPVLLIPFFEEGGRLTIDDVHYAMEGDALVPAAETPFAKDAVFGFEHSNLRDWVEEKTGGRIKADEVASVQTGAIEELRAVRKVGVVNASEMRDLEVLVASIHQSGREFLYRTAGSFVRALAGLPKRPLLERGDVVDPSGRGGLVVVGSYVPKTTAQLEALLADPDVVGVELSVPELDVRSAAEAVERGLRDGRAVVLYTSRDLVTGADAEESLAIGQRVSRALVEIVSGLPTNPEFLIAKGGITSSDIATQALGIRRATVLGQLLPGVPVWRAENGLGFVVFPGNVGDDGALIEAVKKLAA